MAWWGISAVAVWSNRRDLLNVRYSGHPLHIKRCCVLIPSLEATLNVRYSGHPIYKTVLCIDTITRSNNLYIQSDDVCWYHHSKRHWMCGIVATPYIQNDALYWYQSLIPYVDTIYTKRCCVLIPSLEATLNVRYSGHPLYTKRCRVLIPSLKSTTPTYKAMMYVNTITRSDIRCAV